MILSSALFSFFSAPLACCTSRSRSPDKLLSTLSRELHLLEERQVALFITTIYACKYAVFLHLLYEPEDWVCVCMSCLEGGGHIFYPKVIKSFLCHRLNACTWQAKAQSDVFMNSVLSQCLDVPSVCLHATYPQTLAPREIAQIQRISPNLEQPSCSSSLLSCALCLSLRFGTEKVREGKARETRRKSPKSPRPTPRLSPRPAVAVPDSGYMAAGKH